MREVEILPTALKPINCTYSINLNQLYFKRVMFSKIHKKLFQKDVDEIFYPECRRLAKFISSEKNDVNPTHELWIDQFHCFLHLENF